MLAQIQRKKSTLSNWILLIFTLILALSTLNTYLFQDPTNTPQQFDRYHSLLREDIFNNTQQLIIKNKLGTFRFEKVKGKSQNNWNMISPRSLPANQQTIESLLKELKSIRIDKVLPKEPINLANFSLDAPLLTITFIDQYGEKKVLEQGLKKNYNNITYLSLSDKESIYQVEALQTSWESLNLTNFVDSQIISLETKRIASLKLYRGDKKQRSLQLNMLRDNLQWKDVKGGALELEKVVKYIEDIGALRSQLILDRQSDQLKEKLEEYLATPLYVLELEDENKNLFTYTISRLVNTLPDLKIEKRQSFIIRASNREHLYLINKNFMQLFSARQSSFKARKAPFKKLFY